MDTSKTMKASAALSFIGLHRKMSAPSGVAAVGGEKLASQSWMSGSGTLPTFFVAPVSGSMEKTYAKFSGSPAAEPTAYKSFEASS